MDRPSRYGFIFDDDEEDDTEAIQNPLQQPRPPEAKVMVSSLLHPGSSGSTSGMEPWSKRLSKRLSVMFPLWAAPPSASAPSHARDPDPEAKPPGRRFSCREVICVILIPCVLLSLLAIGVCSLLIYFHFRHEFQVKMQRMEHEHFLSQATNRTLQAKDFDKNSWIIDAKLAKLDHLDRTLECVKQLIHRVELGLEDKTLLAVQIRTRCHIGTANDPNQILSDEALQAVRKLDNSKKPHPIYSPDNSGTMTMTSKLRIPPDADMIGFLEDHLQHQNKFCSGLADKISQNLARRTEEKSSLTNAYTEAVTKLIETAGEIERVASGNMYKEQAWVEKLLKRIRNQADVQMQSSHKFLVDQLLVVHAQVLTSVQNLRKLVQEMSSKTDKSLDFRGQSVATHLAIEEQTFKEVTDTQTAFVHRQDSRHSLVKELVQNQISLMDEYEQKSNAFKAQYLALMVAFKDMEDKFLRQTKASRTLVLESMDKAAEESAQFQAALAKSGGNLKDSRAKLLTGLGIESDKFAAEKSSWLDLVTSCSEKLSQATEGLRESGETFANAGKEAWNLHYADTETDLRRKSDDSSVHVTHLQAQTQKLKVVLRESQTRAEENLEAFRVSDEREVRSQQTDLATNCQQFADFAVLMNQQLSTQQAEQIRTTDHIRHQRHRRHHRRRDRGTGPPPKRPSSSASVNASQGSSHTSLLTP